MTASHFASFRVWTLRIGLLILSSPFFLMAAASIREYLRLKARLIRGVCKAPTYHAQLTHWCRDRYDRDRLNLRFIRLANFRPLDQISKCR